MSSKKIKVLVVDDSAIVRKILTDAISAEADLEVVGTAPDPYIARDKILALQPDVITLDIEMPRMDGLTFLKKLMQYHPLPTIVISSLGQASCQATLEALRLGAVEVLAKPGGPYSVGELQQTLGQKIRAAASARIRRSAVPASGAEKAVRTDSASIPTSPGSGYRSDLVIAIGASTGGTEAIADVLTKLPAETPGLLITQHIPPIFSLAFANRLNQICALEVKEASDGDVLLPGRALIAPGNFHMVLRRSGSTLRVQIKDGPQVCYQRPSVDVMFASVADTCGANALGVILTGMGADGAQGLLKMKKAGAQTMAQNEETCVVFGMPREAIRLGAAQQTLSLSQIPQAILQAASTPRIRSVG